MALSKADQEFYEEKLSLKSFGYVFLMTTLIGTIGWPLLYYMQDSSSGQASRWTLNIAFEWAMIGFMVGTMVAFAIYLGFKFLLQMGWLPSRH